MSELMNVKWSTFLHEQCRLSIALAISSIQGLPVPYAPLWDPIQSSSQGRNKCQQFKHKYRYMVTGSPFPLHLLLIPPFFFTGQKTYIGGLGLSTNAFDH